MSKTKKLKFRRSRRNPDRVTACEVHVEAYHESDAYASLDDEIDNYERPEGTLPFENPAYRAMMFD